jgi:hypothetical protein
MPAKKKPIQAQAAEQEEEELPGGPRHPQGAKVTTGNEPYPPGHRRHVKLTPAARIVRDGLIVRRRAQGWPLRAIAEEAGLSERHVTNIIKQAAQDSETSSLLKQDPIQVIEWALDEHQRTYDAYSSVAADAGNDQVLMQALRSREQSLDRIVKLLQATGKLPKELGTLRQVIDFRGIAQEMVRKIQELKAGTATVEEVEEFFLYVAGLGTENNHLLGSAEEEPADEEDEAA